ncbi:MAG: ROK family transcriptional regulator [Anaeromyxobacteraceae bacterium]
MSGDQGLLKRINRMAIVRYVRARPGLARGELAELTGLADSTVSVLVKGLIEEGWLRAHALAESRGAGRRPQVLSTDTTRLALLGAEVGVDYVAVAACNIQGDLLFSRMENYRHEGVERSVRDMAAIVAEARARMVGEGRLPLGLGVGLPGMVELDGTLRLAPNLGWRDVSMPPLISAALQRLGCGDLPVFVLNDANAGALSEHVFGASDATQSMVFLSLGFGIGAGVILDSGLHLGRAGLAGEVGHSVAQPDGLPCTCGRRGCFETLISQRAISRSATGREDPILSVEELGVRVARGEPGAVAAVRAAGLHLGLMVHNLVVAVDPAVVVLGGPLSRLTLLVDTALDEVKRLAGDSPHHRATIRTCRFGIHAGVCGAAASVLDHLLHPLDRGAGVREAANLS